jgi:hypothetical protein
MAPRVSRPVDLDPELVVLESDPALREALVDSGHEHHAWATSLRESIYQHGASIIRDRDVATAELVRVMADGQFRAALFDALHPGHEQALARVSGLRARAGVGS